MKTHMSFLGLVLLFALLGFQPARPVSSASLPAYAAPVDCQAVLSRLARDENWMDQLINPVLSTQAQITERFRLYTSVHACISASAGTEFLQNIRRLTEYFMIFAGGYQTTSQGSTGYLFDLATTKDPAVKRIREQVGIPAPPGYVYLHYYYSRQAMPDLVRRLFQNPDVRGVTIFTRYVAVLAEKSNGTPNTLPKTVSHELVHAYLKSVQGIKNIDAFPVWYDEGMAIHFSGSSEPSCTYYDAGSVNVTSCQTAPEDYVQYAANFDYLEARVGHAKFRQLVKQSFDELDPTVLYTNLGFSNYEDFAVQARAWKRRYDLIVRTSIGAACAIPLIIAIVFYLWQAGKSDAEEEGVSIHAET
jgi:hypothetical protein